MSQSAVISPQISIVQRLHSQPEQWNHIGRWGSVTSLPREDGARRNACLICKFFLRQPRAGAYLLNLFCWGHSSTTFFLVLMVLRRIVKCTIPFPVCFYHKVQDIFRPNRFYKCIPVILGQCCVVGKRLIPLRLDLRLYIPSGLGGWKRADFFHSCHEAILTLPVVCKNISPAFAQYLFAHLFFFSLCHCSFLQSYIGYLP